MESDPAEVPADTERLSIPQMCKCSLFHALGPISKARPCYQGIEITV